MQRSNDRATLESLPTEIKLLILCHLDDPSTLRNLTSASPIYGETERDNREAICTAITINYVLGHGFDPFSAHDVVAVAFGKSRTLEYSENNIHEVGTYRNKDIKDFWDAIQNFYKACQQHKSTKSPKALRIPVAICKPLWQIVHAVGLTVHDDVPLDSNGISDHNGALKVNYLLPQTGPQNGPLQVGTRYLSGKPEFKCYSSTYGSVFLGAHTSQWTEHFKTRVDVTIKRAGQCGMIWDDGVQSMIIDCVAILVIGFCLVWWEVP